MAGGPLLVAWAVFWWWKERRARTGALRSSSALRYSSLTTLNRLRPSKTVVLRDVVRASRWITVALLLVAIARPQTGRKQTEVVTEGIDIMLAIDTSGSMKALDLDGERRLHERRNRLEVVKSVVDTFVQKRPNDQVGMVVFGTEAFTQCPLTLDHGILATFLERVEIGMAGTETAIGSALGTAVKRLQKSAGKSKVVILLTDGRSNTGLISPGKAAQIAAQLGVRIYTIGAGTRGKAPMIVKGGLLGPQVHWEDVQIDEETLQKVATTTGGRYFRAEDAEALQSIYDEIGSLEKTEITMKSYLEYDERFSGFVYPALLILLLEVALLGTRLRKIP